MNNKKIDFLQNSRSIIIKLLTDFIEWKYSYICKKKMSMKKGFILFSVASLILCACNSTSSDEKNEKLSKLQELLDKGVISQSEFNKKKAEIMGNQTDIVSDDSTSVSPSINKTQKNETKSLSNEEKLGLNGHQYVNLDLPSGILWSTVYVGASKSTEAGSLFAWGETEPKQKFELSNYKWYDSSAKKFTKYNCNPSNGTVDNKIVLDKDDDVASVNWGGKWRMPTKEEVEELYRECTWSMENGYMGTECIGYIVKAKNGREMYMASMSNISEETGGSIIWSSTLSEDSNKALLFDNTTQNDMYWGMVGIGRQYGYFIRPVIKLDSIGKEALATIEKNKEDNVREKFKEVQKAFVQMGETTMKTTGRASHVKSYDNLRSKMSRFKSYLDRADVRTNVKDVYEKKMIIMEKRAKKWTKDSQNTLLPYTID